MITPHRSTLRGGSVAAMLIALAGCAVVPPNGPEVMALPGSGKTYEAFNVDDGTCRQTASNAVGPGPSEQQTTNAAVGSAAIGTAIGAVAGAAIGSTVGSVGTGAAVGAGLGLLTGSSVGASNAQATSGDLQRTYDTVYTQCMVAHGNTIQQPQRVLVEPGYMPYPYGPYPYFYGGYYYRPHYYYRRY